MPLLVAALRRLAWWPVIKLADFAFGKPDLTDLTARTLRPPRP